MKNLLYLVTLSFALISCESSKNEVPEQSISISEVQRERIDNLAHRYLELERFSGVVLIAANDSILYHESFGFADYEERKPFSEITTFKVGEITQLVSTQFREGENLADYAHRLGLAHTYLRKSDSSNLAKGYLYHNYRNQGLELQRAPSDGGGLKTAPTDLVKIVSSIDTTLSVDGYLQNDGFSYAVTTKKEDALVVIVLSNRKHPVASEMNKSIQAILQSAPYQLPLPREPYDIDKSALKALVGTYAMNPNMSFEVVVENDELFVLLGPQKVALIPQSEDQFYMENNDAAMRFEKDSNGIVEKVILLNGFIDSDQEAVKVK
ncbi:MAG: DUF3471 domain-containing protein [Bacteroidota bacterium]